MPTETDAPRALFLFAHQDDEFGVFAQIEQELRVGRRVCCIYATDGAATASPDVRDAESRAVLQKLGVLSADIIFAGRQLEISDGQLHRHTNTFIQWLNTFVSLHHQLEVCFVPAWEGGHPDHDILHAIAAESLIATKNIGEIWQYPLYNSRNCFGPFFRVCSPLPENGPVTTSRIGWFDRIRYLRLCLAYPSQWRTWIGLFPFACVYYMLVGVQQLQRVKEARLSQPPHPQPLYYERRGFLDWSSMQLVVDQLIAQKSIETSRDCIASTGST
jgi:LmbE family N-acetylglucosaminyl deacetylase